MYVGNFGAIWQLDMRVHPGVAKRNRAGVEPARNLRFVSGSPDAGARPYCGYSMPGLWNFDVSNSAPVPWQTAPAACKVRRARRPASCASFTRTGS